MNRGRRHKQAFAIEEYALLRQIHPGVFRKSESWTANEDADRVESLQYAKASTGCPSSTLADIGGTIHCCFHVGVLLHRFFSTCPVYAHLLEPRGQFSAL